ncbi:DASH complex subunit Ask1-domain-containing protein [Lipomyces arxii]|uniref:DASH complex subunit Ask1-domain-containing protein n=1 Tax=Lipomyces arxii TaxID=56418 RepID=UPI0034CFA079
MDNRAREPRRSVAYSRPSVIGLPSRGAPQAHAQSRQSTLRQPPGASAPVSSARSLAEELEKVEQSITLTLQEIDQNFSTSHRIITSSILPTVEQYALQSQAVWQSSKFWKEFFESSANVSLAGYEELNTELEETTEAEASRATEYSNTMDYDYQHNDVQTPREKQHVDQSYVDATEDSSFAVYTGQQDSRAIRPGPRSALDFDEEDLEDERNITVTAQFIKTLQLDDQSTPRVVLGDRSDVINGNQMQWADMASPFDDMRTELKSQPVGTFDTSNSMSLPNISTTYDKNDVSSPPLPHGIGEPRTPGRQHGYRRPDNSTIDEVSNSLVVTPESSPFSPFAGTSRPRSNGGQHSVLLHRVLNKQWGIQATPKAPSPSRRPQLPHGSSKLAMGTTTPKNVPSNYMAQFSSSPLDSPPVTHQINSTIFSSPERD